MSLQGDFDYLYGNAGNDTFYVDTPADLVFENFGEGIDTVYADIQGAGYYLYDNIENLTLIGATPFGVGNGLNNTLIGNELGNYLLGGAGDDTLNGTYGNDVLFGEAGADTFVFEILNGADVIGDFQVGVDKIKLVGIFGNFALAQASFIQNGSDGAINLSGGGLVVLHNVTMSQLSATDFIFG
jgi:serralysin